MNVLKRVLTAAAVVALAVTAAPACNESDDNEVAELIDEINDDMEEAFGDVEESFEELGEDLDDGLK